MGMRFVECVLSGVIRSFVGVLYGGEEGVMRFLVERGFYRCCRVGWVGGDSGIRIFGRFRVVFERRFY